MRRIMYLVLFFIIPLHATVEKDLNLASLKKAHHWLTECVAEETSQEEQKTETVDINNVENTWDAYKNIMRKSIALIRKYPKKIREKISSLFKKENNDILPLIAFYFYVTEKKEKTLRYYDAFNTLAMPANQENLWVILIPFTDSNNSKLNDYSVLIIDLNNGRFLAKD